MKMMMLLAILVVFGYGRELTSTSSTNNSYCYTCIDSNSTYWCAKNAYSSSGYCWNSSESKSNCLGSDYQDYVCSNEGLPGRAQNLLCPKETYDCQGTSDFAIIGNSQSNYVTTSIVSPGRTCEYRTLVNNNVSTTLFTSGVSTNETYNVTVYVSFVYYETYLGVYRYHTDLNSYELVREVDKDFYGYINTTMDSNTEIYVQMHPFHDLSCARFIVDVNSPSSSSNDGGSSVVFTVIVILVVLGIIFGLWGCGCFVVYRLCFKTISDSEPIPTTESRPSPRITTGVQIAIDQKRENMYYVNGGAYNKVAIDSQSYSKPQNQNAYGNDENPDAKV